MLRTIVFVCGASLMGLEFLAARMLAPTLGSSLFVWGSVISIVMVALSLGYWLGGQVADRYGSTRTLAPVIALSGLFTVIIPTLSETVLPTLGGLGARTGSLVASAIVFFAPSLLLAMVSPLGVRLATGSGIDHLGRSAGTLYAISTAGSIAGTLATAFWLIPLLTLDGLVVGIGFTLFAVAVTAMRLPNTYAEPAPSVASVGVRPALLRWGAVVAILVGSLIGALTVVRPSTIAEATVGGERVIYRKDTQYHRLSVTEDAEERHLRFDRSHQTAMYLDDPFNTSFRYPGYFHLALALKPDARRVLIVGLGGGSAIKRMWRDYPDMQIDVVEIDPIVTDVAYEYFDLPKSPRIRVFEEDGRRYLKSTKATYDVIIMDAYYADALPSHLTTREFFAEAKARLTPGGVLGYNVISSVDGPGSKLYRSMHRTASGVWDELWTFPIGIGQDQSPGVRRNIIVFASDSRTSEAELRARIANRVGGRVVLDGFTDYAEDLWTERVIYGDVPLLTDQHAPTDSLIEVQ